MRCLSPLLLFSFGKARASQYLCIWLARALCTPRTPSLAMPSPCSCTPHRSACCWRAWSAPVCTLCLQAASPARCKGACSARLSKATFASLGVSAVAGLSSAQLTPHMAAVRHRQLQAGTSQSLPVGDGLRAVSLVRQEQGEHAELVLAGPVLRRGRPAVELAYQRQCLQRGLPSIRGHSTAAAAGLSAVLLCSSAQAVMHRAQLWLPVRQHMCLQEFCKQRHRPKNGLCSLHHVQRPAQSISPWQRAPTPGR